MSIEFFYETGSRDIRVVKDGNAVPVWLESIFYSLPDGAPTVEYNVITKERYDTYSSFLDARKAIVDYVTETLYLDENESKLLFYHTQNLLYSDAIAYDAYIYAYRLVKKAKTENQNASEVFQQYLNYLAESQYILSTETMNILSRQWDRAVEELTPELRIDPCCLF